MGTITEKGTLAVGIEHGSKIHKEFELRPQMVRDSIEAMEDERAVKNDSYYGICLLVKQIKTLGDIPGENITPELLMDMTEVDFKILMEGKEALDKRLCTFRDKG